MRQHYRCLSTVHEHLKQTEASHKQMKLTTVDEAVTFSLMVRTPGDPHTHSSNPNSSAPHTGGSLDDVADRETAIRRW